MRLNTPVNASQPRAMMFQLAGNRWAVGDDGDGQIFRKVADNLGVGGAAIEEYGLARPNHASRIGAEPPLLIRGDALPGRKVRQVGRERQCAAMHPLQQFFPSHFPQVPADRVLGEVEIIGQRLGDDLAVTAQNIENESFSLAGEHVCFRTIIHEFS